MYDIDALLFQIWKTYSTILFIAAAISLLILAVAIMVDWRILNKAGDKGWKALIPVYGRLCVDKAACGMAFAVIKMILSIVSVIWYLIIYFVYVSWTMIIIFAVFAVLNALMQLAFYVGLATRFGFPTSVPLLAAALSVIGVILQVTASRPAFAISGAVIELTASVLILVEVLVIAFSSRYQYDALPRRSSSFSNSNIYGEYNFIRENAEESTETIWRCPKCGRSNKGYYCSYCGSAYTGKGKKISIGK